MGNAITYDARMIWLDLRRTGGWWTISLLRQQWANAYAEFELRAAIDALVAGGFLERREFRDAVSYGFTSSCKLLPGYDAPTALEAA